MSELDSEVLLQCFGHTEWYQHLALTQKVERAERAACVAFLRKPSEYGDPCSADREVLAQQIERGEHLR